MAGKTTTGNAAPPPAREGGQAPALATKGKARAAGNVDVLKPGDPGYGGTAGSERKRGSRVEVEKGFQLSADHEPDDMVRVFDADPNNKDEDVVLWSGTKKQAAQLHKLLSNHLKK